MSRYMLFGAYPIKLKLEEKDTSQIKQRTMGQVGSN
jgi:hypothetical protein